MNIDVLLCARGYPAGGSFWYLSSGTGLYRTLDNTIQILLSLPRIQFDVCIW